MLSGMRLTVLALLVAAGLLVLMRLRPGEPTGAPSSPSEPPSLPSVTLSDSEPRAPSASTPPARSAGPETPAEEFRRIADELYAGDCPQYGLAPRKALEAELADPA